MYTKKGLNTDKNVRNNFQHIKIKSLKVQNMYCKLSANLRKSRYIFITFQKTETVMIMKFSTLMRKLDKADCIDYTKGISLKTNQTFTSKATYNKQLTRQKQNLQK